MRIRNVLASVKLQPSKDEWRRSQSTNKAREKSHRMNWDARRSESLRSHAVNQQSVKSFHAKFDNLRMPLEKSTRVISVRPMKSPGRFSFRSEQSSMRVRNRLGPGSSSRCVGRAETSGIGLPLPPVNSMKRSKLFAYAFGTVAFTQGRGYPKAREHAVKDSCPRPEGVR